MREAAIANVETETQAVADAEEERIREEWERLTVRTDTRIPVEATRGRNRSEESEEGKISN